LEPTHKQSILAVARKQKTEKLPFIARIDLWYNYHLAHNSLPEKYRNWNMLDIVRDQGAGMQLRNIKLWKFEYKNIEIVVDKSSDCTSTEFRTPKGILKKTTALFWKQGATTEYELEYPFKSTKDYPAIEFLLENTVLVPYLDDYLKAENMVNEDGLVICGESYSPMQAIMRRIMGYEKFFYELNDHPRKVEHLFELMKEVVWQEIKILTESPLEIPKVCGNWTDDIHTPIFQKYFVPWFKDVVEYVHANGKITQVHIDGEMRRLISMFLETRIDVGEAWSPAPMTSLTNAEFKNACGDQVTIWGGVPAILFQPQYSNKEFDDYILNLFKEIAPGYNFILGMGDNFPVDGNIDRIGRIVELIEKYGYLPIKT
jgi:uroporphyrinogen-III decarboxylase